jgi:hypothetical protein
VSPLGPRRARDLAFVMFLREVMRAMRYARDSESLAWLGLFVEQIEYAVCVRCLSLEDALHGIMEAQPTGSILDPLPEPVTNAGTPRAKGRRRWFPHW